MSFIKNFLKDIFDDSVINVEHLIILQPSRSGIIIESGYSVRLKVFNEVVNQLKGFGIDLRKKNKYKVDCRAIVPNSDSNPKKALILFEIVERGDGK